MAKKYIVYLEKTHTKEIEVTVPDDVDYSDFEDWAFYDVPSNFADYGASFKIMASIGNKELELETKVIDEYRYCRVSDVLEKEFAFNLFGEK